MVILRNVCSVFCHSCPLFPLHCFEKIIASIVIMTAYFLFQKMFFAYVDVVY